GRGIGSGGAARRRAGARVAQRRAGAGARPRATRAAGRRTHVGAALAPRPEKLAAMAAPTVAAQAPLLQVPETRLEGGDRGDARGLRAQDARPEAKAFEAGGLQQVAVARRPAALGADRQHAPRR